MCAKIIWLFLAHLCVIYQVCLFQDDRIFLERQWHLRQVCTQAAEWLPQIQAITAFTLAQTLGTRQEQCHVSLVLPAVMAFKAVTAMPFVSSHPYILTDCQIDVKLKKLSCSVFSWGSRAVILVTAVRCEAEYHTHPKWLAQSCVYRCDEGRCCRSTLANKYSMAWCFHDSCIYAVLQKAICLLILAWPKSQ